MPSQGHEYKPEEGQVRDERSGACGDIVSMDTHGGGVGSKSRWQQIRSTGETQSTNVNVGGGAGGGGTEPLDPHGGGDIGSKG